jgi:hypothetical protein
MSDIEHVEESGLRVDGHSLRVVEPKVVNVDAAKTARDRCAVGPGFHYDQRLGDRLIDQQAVGLAIEREVDG